MEGAGNKKHPDPSSQGWMIRPGKISTLVGPFWERRVGGNVQIGIVCDPRHDNGKGKMHGGLLMTLADMGMGAVIRSTGDDVQCVTVQLDVAFLQAVDIGDFVTTECHIQHRTSGTIFVSGTLKTGEKAVASAQGVFKSLANVGLAWQGG
ncbi:PaaI family thioesterase [Bradyrhizobium sp. 31Argb]|uniref:PaaI family thioesterase n=1 Tax=unclassified Bradyrhizobium TaxID=2631580 RepID=UPI0013EEE5BF|nr:PaaI family thioesterase [Bradyrhizobium sp. Leo170]